ncbi:ankyrin repeat-containing domain protein [Daldinia sp. FL1419]|nr:ankyrin repeat-containing domain protein [Daldinia sp. FL1419]
MDAEMSEKLRIESSGIKTVWHGGLLVDHPHYWPARLPGSQSSVLHWAASCGNVRVLKAAIGISREIFPAYLDVKDSVDLTALTRAAMNGHIEIMEELIAEGCLIDALMDSLYILCQERKNPSIFRPQRDSFHLYTFTPLDMAIRYNQEEAAALLAQHHQLRDDQSSRMIGSDPSLHLAARMGMPRVVETLLRRDDASRLDTEGFTPLHHAVGREDNREVIDILCNHGARINELPGRFFNTPLERAIMRRNPRNALQLIRRNLKSEKDITWVDGALDEAIMSKVHSVIEACINILNARGRFREIENIFASVATHPDKSIFKFLAEFLGDKLSREHLGKGQGYLHWACQQRQVNQRALTLAMDNKYCPQDINAKDASGRTPLDYARQNGHDDIANLVQVFYSCDDTENISE